MTTEVKEIVVEEMTAADIDVVHQIEERSITPPWTKQGFSDALANENAVFHVAKADDKVVGYCGLYFAADEGEITNVAVLPELRKQGIADKLLTAVLDFAEKKQLVQIFLEVRASNLPAQQLYEKHGFDNVGIRKNFYREPKEDAIVMLHCNTR